jgi:hypothetical protein
MGLKGLEVSCSWDMEPMWYPSWEPFWQAVDEVRLPLHFHTFPTTPPRARLEAPQVRCAAMFTCVSAFQVGLIHIIAGMMGRRFRTLSAPARVLPRERRRMARLRIAPHGFRVRGPLEEQFAGLAPEVVHKITCENAGKFYGLIN